MSYSQHYWYLIDWIVNREEMWVFFFYPSLSASRSLSVCFGTKSNGGNTNDVLMQNFIRTGCYSNIMALLQKLIIICVCFVCWASNIFTFSDFFFLIFSSLNSWPWTISPCLVCLCGYFVINVLFSFFSILQSRFVFILSFFLGFGVFLLFTYAVPYSQSLSLFYQQNEKRGGKCCFLFGCQQWLMIFSRSRFSKRVEAISLLHQFRFSLYIRYVYRTFLCWFTVTVTVQLFSLSLCFSLVIPWTRSDWELFACNDYGYGYGYRYDYRYDYGFSHVILASLATSSN